MDRKTVLEQVRDGILTPEEADRAMQALSIPTTPAQIKAARLLGLPGYEEAIA